MFVLALGMCASISIFAFVDAALIKPLPYRDPARLLAKLSDGRSRFGNVPGAKNSLIRHFKKVYSLATS